MSSALAPPRFALPPGSDAATPPEARGLARDQVRLAVARPDDVRHARAEDLPAHLEAGDLLVVNTSATLPSALVARRRGSTADWGLHVSTALADGSWVVELRRPDRAGPATPEPGEVLHLPDGVRLHLQAPHPAGQQRLWRAVTHPRVDRVPYLREHGSPIRYPYVRGHWPIEALQNVYAEQPGSAEMASAGRPLSERLLVRLMARGVVVAPLVLHTGVASQEAHEPPQPEWFEVPETTARLVAGTRAAGARVVAVGTTVVRALESAALRAGDGPLAGVSGWTDLVLGRRPGTRRARIVTGLLTGLHEPEASHLDLLEAVAGAPLVTAAYDAVAHTDAVGPRYLWHEFGDSMLLLP
ncbi:S-adenosylmethionine:tRNA ribosyltransferase-isomerase [Nocardioides nanhaiensis]|uniref:S-adenosylmethionine:tRNA ribosyltransferase-isomerase n=1 Tax=Nocardioides nanhaiensis TaxID=1476871 RepID=A0ABP8W9L2_9ACTN